METLKVRRIHTPEQPRTKRRKNVCSDTRWEASGQEKRRRFHPLVWLPLPAGLCVLAGVGAYLFKSRPETATQSAQSIIPPPVTMTAREQEQAQAEAKLALDCVAKFFGAPHDLLKLAQCRPVPGLVECFKKHEKELEAFAAASPSPGGNLKRQPPFIGIPLSFRNLPPRVAWVEMRGGAARLDLDSFLGLGSVPWSELESAPPETPVSLRGTLVPLDGDDGRMDFIGPDGRARIRLHGSKPEELVAPRAARVTVSRVAETTLRRAGWVLVSHDGWEWLAENTATPKGEEAVR